MSKLKLKKELSEEIMNIFLSNPKSGYNYKQIAKALGEKGSKHKKYISGILFSLAKEKNLIEFTPGKFKVHPIVLGKRNKKGPYITGIVDMKQTGKAYIINDDYLEDIKISSNNTNTALHGDKVKVFLFPKRKNQKIEGEIIEVIERNKTIYTGIIEISDKFSFVIPDNKSMPVDVYVPLENINNAKNGQKVIVEITDWPKHSKNPFGRVKKVLGNPGENEVEIESIILENNISTDFPDKVISESNSISDKIPSGELKIREDFRDVLTFTIDPADAKDFDDALSFKKLSEDLYEIGVHIADVSHFVKEKTELDKEAYDRATSTYLVDRVIPMLPTVLSNVICSLNPDSDRLAFSVIFNINSSGRVTKKRYVKAVIRSNKRFSYEDVQKIIETNSGPYSNEINIINSIAKNLREKRLKNGSIMFDRKEVKFNLDSEGKPVSVYFKEQKDAHKLIEEFMLLANKAVAEKIGKSQDKKVFVYRIHDIPNPEKLNSFSEFVAKLGYKIKTDRRKNISNSFNQLLKDVEGKAEENIIEALTIRTMAKAEYSTINIGHYGLAFDYYTHFTSPIRRYPDLMVHRLLHSYITGSKKQFNQNEYESKCKHSSEQERVAQEAEWASIKYKQAEFLSDKIGQSFDGLISGVSKWGIFVELVENKCEGMIPLRTLDDDYYFLDEDNFQVVGSRKNRKFKLGDEIKVQISNVNMIKKEVDLELV